MGKTKTITEKQKQRAELNAVLDFNEAQLVGMQKQEWNDLSDHQINILENFIATAIATMRICPPAYVGVASNTVRVRAKAVEAINLATNATSGIIQRNTPVVLGAAEGVKPLKIDYGTGEKSDVRYSVEAVPPEAPEMDDGQS